MTTRQSTSRTSVVLIALITLGLATDVWCASPSREKQPSKKNGRPVLADWPTYRADSNRSAYIADSLDASLSLAWSYAFSTQPAQAWVGKDTRMAWDAAFQPIAADGKVFVGNSVTGGLYAFDLGSGKKLWSFFTESPIRFAPSFWKDRVYVVSDDGHLYCLQAKDGSLAWKLRGGADEGMIFGNGSLVSRWPARGGPVIEDGIVYFGCGIWPTDGVYIYAVNAETGKVLWCNDTSGNIYMKQPHDAGARSGLAAQGYLTILKDRLLVPTGRAVPAVLDKTTGKLIHFTLATPRNNMKVGGGELYAVEAWDGYSSGGLLYRVSNGHQRFKTGQNACVTPEGQVTFVSKKQVIEAKLGSIRAKDRRGKMVDKAAMVETGKCGTLQGEVRVLVRAGDHVIAGMDNTVVVLDAKTRKQIYRWPVKGSVYGLCVSGGRVVVSTNQGVIYCFGRRGRGKKYSERPKSAIRTITSKDNSMALSFLRKAGVETGKMVVLGRINDLGVIRAIARRKPGIDIVIVDSNESWVQTTRTALASWLILGSRVQVLKGDVAKTRLPTHCASLLVRLNGRTPVEEVKRLLRPHGGKYFTSWSAAKPSRVAGPPEGEGVWTHQYHDPANTACSEDKVKGPLATRWFNDLHMLMPDRDSRAPSPLYQDGRLIVEGVNVIVCVDVFTGQELWRLPLPGILQHMNQHHYLGNVTGSNICLSDDTLFVVRDAECLKVDPVTGKIKGTLHLPREAKAWGALAYKDGILFGGAANTDHIVLWIWRRSKMDKVFTESKAIYAMNPDSGKVLWSYKAKHSIRHSAIAITQNSVLLIDRPVADFDRTLRSLKWLKAREQGKETPVNHLPGVLVALDRRTGVRQWTAKKGIDGTILAASESNKVVVMGFGGAAFPLISSLGDRLVGFHLDTGRQLWENTKLSQRARQLIHNNKVVVDPYAYDIKTGAKIPDFHLNRTYGCGTVVASENLLHFRSGTLGYAGVTPPHKVMNFGGIRPGCWLNMIPVAGMVVMPDAMEGCACSYLNKAAVALEQRAPEPIVRKRGPRLTLHAPRGYDIKYTVNGLPPKIESKTYRGGAVRVPGNATFKVKAFKHGMPPSETVVLGSGK